MTVILSGGRHCAVCGRASFLGSHRRCVKRFQARSQRSLTHGSARTTKRFLSVVAGGAGEALPPALSGNSSDPSGVRTRADASPLGSVLDP